MVKSKNEKEERQINWAWFIFGVANLVGAVLVYFLL